MEYDRRKEAVVFNRIAPAILFAVLFCCSSAYGFGADAIIGFWNTPERDARFEIYRCGAQYCGKVSSLAEPDYPPTDRHGRAGLPKTDRKNPDPALRSRPLVGLPLIEDVRYEGDNSWHGKIYNPEDGQKYRCNFSLARGGRELKVRGYIWLPIFGQTQTWTRQPKGSG
jgi:uncharacterized protein (DUF2147 family)